jgi:hypothetical protein
LKSLSRFSGRDGGMYKSYIEKLIDLKISVMYTSQILHYLLWPVMILISWFVIRIILSLYEKRFPDNEQKD